MPDLKAQQNHPFRRAYCEWTSEKSTVTVMYQTMPHYLWTIWFEQCAYNYSEEPANEIETTDGLIVNHTRFNPEKINAPGIHKERSDDDTYTHYHIIVPDRRLTPEACEEWLDRLNEQYDESFKLRT